MDILRAFIAEVSPPFRDWEPLARELEALLYPIYYTFKDNGWRWSTCGSISKIFNRVFRKYGQANVIFLNDEELTIKGTHLSNDNITLSISGQYLVESLKEYKKWQEFCKLLAIVHTHELVHRWQQQRRRGVKGRSNPKHYAADPAEIDSWAHDIVNDVGIKQMTEFLHVSRNWNDIANMSYDYRIFLSYLDDVPNYTKKKVMNRLHRAIVDIVLHSEKI